ncbi:phage tail tube protein [Enterococcus sp. DIV1420a]|uniref:phage tail tube protein n=1 Tax=Enterococcus sp. DIV1420a TaxID=2774672 RepID=UPI0036D525FF
MLTMNLQKFADGEMAGLLSKGTVLSYKDGATTKVIAAVKSIPAIGSDPEKVDVTNLSSERKEYIKGIQDTENLEFAIVYQGKNFSDIHAMVKAGKAYDFTITYPDGMKVEFTGEPDYKLDGVEVNSAVGFSLVVVVNKAPVVTPASITAITKPSV